MYKSNKTKTMKKSAQPIYVGQGDKANAPVMPTQRLSSKLRKFDENKCSDKVYWAK